ncbi:MAG TPA: hypothetical protein PK874_06105 [Desulfobacteraceae bacterium]|nr:hypothetical protein [Desulfobacteraceae bacterium]HPJ68938.1 hypothetical protein [Desulfobacteraceae bacterium]HPQ27418.1 hypothetical protein [Desulfobacteraceae bacterium]
MRNRNRIIIGFLVFFVSYIVFLVLWVQIKPYYGVALTQMGTRLAAWTTGVKVDKIQQGKDLATITFSRVVIREGRLGDILLDIKISVSNYSFNVPLTFALAVSLLAAFKWRKKAIIEACLILIFVHLLYVYFFSCLKICHQLSIARAESYSRAVQFFLQFMWAFTDNLIIRFEPFLVGVYLWLRNLGRLRLSD